jgi:Fe-S oxidoreductase
LVELFPQDQNARRLSKQTFTLAEFLQKYAPDYGLPKLQRTAVVHGHCHEKAVLNFDCEKTLLEKMGLELKAPETGCCGMAGAFGFEKKHLDVSLACGERVLLPAVREATRDTLIIADGFSCREQVRQMSDRVPLHLAQVLKMAIDEGPQGPSGNFPEAGYITKPALMSSARKVFSILALTTLGLTEMARLFRAKRNK